MMTCLEKIKIEKPNAVDAKFVGGVYGCPSMYGLADPDCPGTSEENCRKCWENTLINNTMINFIRNHTDEEVFDYLEKNNYSNTFAEFLKSTFIKKNETLECPYDPGDIIWVVADNGEIRREKVRSLCFFEDDYGISTYTNMNLMRVDFDKYVRGTKEAALALQKERQNASN